MNDDKLNQFVSKFLIYVYNNNFFAKKIILIRNRKYLQPFKLADVKKFSLEFKTIKFDKKIIKSKNYINWFYNKLSKHCTEEELTFFYQNIKTFKTYHYLKNKNNLFWMSPLAEYDKSKNSMMVYGYYEHETIYHEMLHMASNPISLDNDLNGFRYRIKNTVIGFGLNEGYTELLTQRHLNVEDGYIYIFEKSVACALEKIVGRKKMQNQYFTCNLHGLFDELQKYYKKETIEKFMINFDFISSMTRLRILDDYTLKLLLKKINYVVCFLYYGYCKKMKAANLSDDEVIQKINEYSNILNFYYEENNKNLICYKVSEVNNIICRYFNDIKIDEDENFKIIL